MGNMNTIPPISMDSFGYLLCDKGIHPPVKTSRLFGLRSITGLFQRHYPIYEITKFADLGMGGGFMLIPRASGYVHIALIPNRHVDNVIRHTNNIGILVEATGSFEHMTVIGTMKILDYPFIISQWANVYNVYNGTQQ